MVAFYMTEEAAAAIVGDVLERNPPPKIDALQIFSAAVALFGFKTPKEVKAFGRKCGFRDIQFVAVPCSAFKPGNT